MSRLFTLLFLIAVAVCCGRYDPAVNDALRYAGDNRGELEKVIRHYSTQPEDSLKLKAALFLIRNMPYHVSYRAEPYYAYCDALDSLFTSGTEGDELREKTNAIADRFRSRLRLEYDIRVITADYLI